MNSAISSKLSLLKDKSPSLFKKSLPYIFMLIASCVPLAIYFYDSGYNFGDDSIWHLVYTYDVVYGFEHGFFGITPGHTLMGSLGYNVYLFYAPFPHYLAAWIKYLFSFMGAQIGTILKVISWASIYFSGIVTYKLAKKVTGDWKLALAVALIFIFYPYRIMNFLYRAAYAEGVAIGFIPLIFYGIYSLLHDEEFKISNYLAVILGVSLIVLSHPFTALISVLAAGIFAICNPKKLANYLRKKSTWIALPISVLLIIGLVGFYFLPTMSALFTNYYRMSYPYSVQTNVEWLIHALDGSFRLSGYLNFPWLTSQLSNGWTSQTDSVALWILSLVFFVAAAALSIFLLSYGRRKGKDKYALPAAVGVMLLPLFVVNRQEMVLGTIIFIFGLIIFEMSADDKEFGKDEMRREALDLRKNPYIYCLGALITITQLYLWTDWIWRISPSSFYNAQFPFRWWSIFSFLAVFLLMFLIKPFKGKKIAAESVLAIAVALYVASMGPVDKRMANANGTGFQDEPTLSTVKSQNLIGWHNEYLPEIFYDSTYESEYTTSLYSYVKSMVRYNHDWVYDKEDYETSFLTGHGEITIDDLNTPSVDMTITATEDSLIQLAQFYYDGYIVYLTSSSGESSSVTPIYVDGLLAFEVPAGQYKAELRYIGSTSYRVFTPIAIISAAAVIITPIVFEVLKRKKKKEEAVESPAS